MRRLTSALLALLVLLVASSAAGARQATPPEIEVAPGITASPLVMASLDALPRDPSLAVFARVTLAPGAVVPPGGDQSVGLYYVESGDLTVTGPAAVPIIRAGESTAEMSDPAADVVVSAGDTLAIGLCFENGFRNDGDEPVSLLIGGVSALDPSGCPGPTPVAESETPGLEFQFIVLGTIDPPPARPARLAMTRLTYAPGAADPAPAVNGGTVLAHIESGTFGMTIESGEGIYVRKPDDPSNFYNERQEPLIEEIEATLNPGDLVWQKSGTVFQARNAGTEPASVVIFILDAASAEPATPTT
jgi:mannose-6-phosphate isomerase-like protein (cupin superfamily)